MRRHLRLEGHSFREILAVERMSAARTMLMEGRSNVSEAASIGGYASLSHFAKRFKQIYGYLPSRIEQVIAQTHRTQSGQPNRRMIGSGKYLIVSGGRAAPGPCEIDLAN